MTPISPSSPERLRSYPWAHDAKDGKALTGDELLDFVNNDLLKTLESLELAPDAPLRQRRRQGCFY